MGASQSSPKEEARNTSNTKPNVGLTKSAKRLTQEEAIRYKNVVVDGVVKEKINVIDGLINNFNNNDVKSMIQNMSSQELYKDVLTPELVGKVSDLHNRVLAQMEDESNMKSNAALRNVMSQIVDQQTQQKIDEFMQDPTIGKNPLIKNDIESLANSIKVIGTRYRYFEYKYIQLNLFVIGFVKHVYDTMGSFIESNMEYFEAREQYRTQLTVDFIKALKGVLETNDLIINDKELTDLNKLMNAMKEDVNEKRLETKEKIQQIANANMKSIDEYVEQHRADIYKGVPNSKATGNTKPSNSTVNTNSKKGVSNGNSNTNGSNSVKANTTAAANVNSNGQVLVKNNNVVRANNAGKKNVDK